MDDPLRKQYENNSARDGYGHYGSRDFPVENTPEDFVDEGGATHRITITIDMEEMDGDPFESALVLTDPRHHYEVLRDYLDSLDYYVEAEEV